MATFIKYKTAKGDTRYRFKVYLGIDPVTGKRIETSRQGFKTKRDAKIALETVQAEFNKNGWNRQQKTLTVNDVVDQFLVTYKNKVKPQTYSNNMQLYNKHFRSGFGKCKIAKVKVNDIQQLVNSVAQEHSTSYKTYINILQQTFEYAYRVDIIEQNPFNKIYRPKLADNKRSSFYSKDELKNFLEVAKKDDRYIYDIGYLLSFSGMRAGEMVALTDDDIDFENKTIGINKTFSRDKLSRKVIVSDPKTKNSKRVISVNDECMRILKDDKNLILGDKPWIPTQRLSRFLKRHKDLKPITVHGFRHTHASMLFEAGADIKQVQKRLGHANVKITLDIYTHITRDHEQAAVKMLDDFFK